MFYLQYQNKENLFRCAAAHGKASLKIQFTTLAYDNKTLDDVLLTIIEHIQLLAADPNVRNLARLLIGESQRFPNIATAMLDEFKEMVAPITLYLDRATKEYQLAISDPLVATSDLIMLALGGFNFLLSKPEKTSKAQRKKRAIEIKALILNGWKGPK